MSSPSPQAAAGDDVRREGAGRAPRAQRAMRAARRGAVQGALAGGLVSILEGGWASLLGARLETAAILAGCAALAGALLALALGTMLGAAAALPWPAAWRRGWRETAPALLAWRVVLAGAAVGLLGVVTYRAAAWVHVVYRFNEPGPVALLLAAVVVVAAVGLGGAALLVDALVARRIARRAADAAAAAPSRWRWRAKLVAAAALLALLPVAVVRWTVPAVTLTPVVLLSVLVAASGALHVARVGSGRAAALAAAAIALGGALALWASTGSPAARGAATSTGVLSPMALRALWRLGDGDGDGYARASFGGADCDDGDRRRSPRELEVAGNGVDENCSGADGQVAAVQARLTAPPIAASAMAAAGASAVNPAARPNILLVSFDALRPDHLGAWGYRRPVSQILDSLAARGARFEWAMTSCPSTRCAIPALLTGRFAPTLTPSSSSAAESSPDEPAAAAIPTLASALGAAGWDTVTISCCERFTGDSSDLAGFSLVDTSADAVRQRRPGQSNGDAVVEKAMRWLGRRSAAAKAASSGATAAGAAVAPPAPFFLWMHLFDTHSPYQAPYQPRRFGDRDVDRYDAEIQFVDEQLGRLLAEMQALGLIESTIVVVAADHGDEFGEHGIRFHARSLFNQVVRIPLIVYVPPGLGGPAQGRVEKTPVSLVDVMPTVLELAGVPLPAGMNGRSLAAAVRGTGPAPARPVLIELTPDWQIRRDMAAVVWGDRKAIWDREANAWSLFALGADPDDEHDLIEGGAAEHAATLGELQALLRSALDAELGRLPPLTNSN